MVYCGVGLRSAVMSFPHRCRHVCFWGVIAGSVGMPDIQPVPSSALSVADWLRRTRTAVKCHQDSIVILAMLVAPLKFPEDSLKPAGEIRR